MTPEQIIAELFAAHRWLMIPLLVFVACLYGAIWALVDGAMGYASTRLVRKPRVSTVVPIISRTPRPFSQTAAQGFNRRKFDAIVGGRAR